MNTDIISSIKTHTPLSQSPQKAALISVFDKQEIVTFAQSLHEFGYVILSTGGTHRVLADHNIPVVSIEDYTGSPEFFDGRVKTLHPKIYAGILARRDSQDMHILVEKKNLRNRCCCCKSVSI